MTTCKHRVSSSYSLAEDLWTLFVGDHIGSGMYRDVFEVKFDDDLVIKVEKEGSYCNTREWIVWNDTTEEKWSDWLAPCVAISENGKFLIQQKTKRIINKQLPDKIPSFLDDTHFDNWGIYKNRLVCHDYAFNRFVCDVKPKMIKKVWK